MSREAITPLQDIDDLKSVALDLSELLASSDNADIKIHFPVTVRRHTGDLAVVHRNLIESAQACEPGRREQFIIFSGVRAVGMSVVTLLPEVPKQVDKTWPNLSGFICQPFRGQGLGRISMERRMIAVRDDFDNHAWTYVRKGNSPAEHLVTDVGFRKTDHEVPGQENQHLYLYS